MLRGHHISVSVVMMIKWLLRIGMLESLLLMGWLWVVGCLMDLGWYVRVLCLSAGVLLRMMVMVSSRSLLKLTVLLVGRCGLLLIDNLSSIGDWEAF